MSVCCQRCLAGGVRSSISRLPISSEYRMAGHWPCAEARRPERIDEVRSLGAQGCIDRVPEGPSCRAAGGLLELPIEPLHLLAWQIHGDLRRNLRWQVRILLQKSGHLLSGAAALTLEA